MYENGYQMGVFMKRLFSQLFKHTIVLLFGLSSAFCAHAMVTDVAKVEYSSNDGSTILLFGYLNDSDKNTFMNIGCQRSNIKENYESKKNKKINFVIQETDDNKKNNVFIDYYDVNKSILSLSSVNGMSTDQSKSNEEIVKKFLELIKSDIGQNNIIMVYCDNRLFDNIINNLTKEEGFTLDKKVKVKEDLLEAIKELDGVVENIDEKKTIASLWGNNFLKKYYKWFLFGISSVFLYYKFFKS